MSLRKDIEDAAIAALADLKLLAKGGSADGYLKAIKPYAGDFTGPDPTDPEMARLVYDGTPCVGVATGDGNYGDFLSDHLRGDLDLTLELLVVSRNARGAEERNRGDGGLGDDPGIYQMIEDIRERLFGPDLGVDGAGGLTPVRESPVVRTESISAWHLVYEIGTDVVAPDPEADDLEYEEIDTSINNADDDTADPVVTGRHDLEPFA